jgi:hypothetical protein
LTRFSAEKILLFPASGQHPWPLLPEATVADSHPVAELK